jgi:hypothetical protein
MRKIIVFVVMILFLGITLCYAQEPQEESITITTYYPSPYGVYRTMRLSPSSRPESCQEGELYYDDGTGSYDAGLYLCDATPAWQTFGGGGFWAASPSDPNDIYNTNTDAVGIGTADPTQKLDVEGVVLGSMPLVAVSMASVSSNVTFECEVYLRSLMVVAVPSTGKVYLRFSSVRDALNNQANWSGWTDFGTPEAGERIVGISVDMASVSPNVTYKSDVYLRSIIIARMSNGNVYMRFSSVRDALNNQANWSGWTSFGNPGF